MDTLYLIVKKMLLRKEQSEFKTYRNAYRWAIRNISSLKVQSFKIQKLEKAYYKAKSEGKVGIKKFPFHYYNKSNENQFTGLGLEQ